MTMEYYLLLNHWASLVRNFKDREKDFGIEPRDSEQLLQQALNWIRYTRIRQWNLFQQQRGEDYDLFVQHLTERGFTPTAIQRFAEDEDLWKTTLEMGEH